MLVNLTPTTQGPKVMICSRCKKEIPDTAEVCPHCDTRVSGEFTPEEEAAALELMANLTPELMQQLGDAFEQSETCEEFVNRIMIGDCPKCGSSKTSDCESDPQIQNPCIARCADCGQLWCPDCGELFKNGQFSDHDCPAWDDIDFDEDEDFEDDASEDE
jgi:RNA polymerase subunit RPABC4/transcription elongation factor Spt4